MRLEIKVLLTRHARVALHHARHVRGRERRIHVAARNGAIKLRVEGLCSDGLFDAHHRRQLLVLHLHNHFACFTSRTLLATAAHDFHRNRTVQKPFLRDN